MSLITLTNIAIFHASTEVSSSIVTVEKNRLPGTEFIVGMNIELTQILTA
jgi:hypothetical protein